MTHRYEFLDGLRGVAAIMVVTRHFLDPMDWFEYVSHAQLAVDFFFCLSGFVLTHAYGDRLGKSLTLRQFYGSRWIRLYPMMALGIVAGTAVFVVRLVMLGETERIWSLLGSSLTNLLMLPSPLFLEANNSAWPANGPQWSLFFECIALLAFPWLLRADTRPLLAVLAVSGMALLAQSLWSQGISWGWEWAIWPSGLLRVAYPFTMGVFLFRLASGTPPKNSESAAKCLGLAMALVLIFVVQVPPRFNGIYEAIGVLVLLPTLLFCAAAVGPTAWLRPLTLWLGAISYPLYAIHLPIVRGLMGGTQRLDGLAPWQQGLVIAMAVAGCMLLAWLALKKIDEPVRRWLNDRRSSVMLKPSGLRL